VHPSQDFDKTLQLGDEIRAAADRLTATGKFGDCKLDVPAAKNLPDLHVDREQLARLFDIILQKASALSGGKGTIRTDIQSQAVHGTPGLRVSITGTGDGWANAGSEAMFSAISPGASDMGLELLSAFFIAHHHGGELRFAGGGFDLLLPVDPQAVEVRAPDVSFLDELFDSFYLQNQGQPG
jgi:hypothetical protein